MRSRSGTVPSGPCHHSHKTLGSRRLSPRGRRSTSTRMSVPTTMGRGPRVPFAAWLWTFGCISAHARTRTDPYPPASSQRCSAEGSGQVLGSAQFILGPWRRGRRCVPAVAQARVAVEAAPGAQAEEDLARAPLQSLLHLDWVVARIEDEQRDSVSPTRRKGPPQERPHLLGGDRIGVLGGTESSHIHGSGPTLAHEAQLCDELVGPARHDGLAGGVPRRMVVVAALGAALRIVAVPHAHINGVDEGLAFSAGERMAGQEFP